MAKNINIPEIEKYYIITEDGNVFSKIKNRYLKPNFNSSGYIIYYLKYANSPGWYLAHRLVAAKYIQTANQNCEINHKDRNKSNNHYSNLEYVTHSQNILKSFREQGRVQTHSNFKHTPEIRKKMSEAKKKKVDAFIGETKVESFNSIEDLITRFRIYRKKFNVIMNRGGIYNAYIFKFR